MTGISREKIEIALRDAEGMGTPIDETDVLNIILRVLEDEPVVDVTQ